MDFELRETVSLHIGSDYRVFWNKDDKWIHYFTAELMELNTTDDLWDGEVVVDTAVFGNGRIIDLTHPDLYILEVNDAS